MTQPEPVDWARVAELVQNTEFGRPTVTPDEEPPTTAPAPGRARRGAQKNSAPIAGTAPKVKTPLPPYREGMFVQPLEEMYGYLGMALMLVDQVCATAVVNSAHDCAVALDKLAKTNHAARRLLVTLTQSSAIGQVLVAHVPILTAVMMHHVPAARILSDRLTGVATEIVEETT